MNLKVILKDYIGFLNSRGIKFPDNYSYKMNDEMLQKMKLILEDVDYDFILDVIEEFYDALKAKVINAKGKVCIKFANRIVVGEIKNINYSSPDTIASIDVIDKKKQSINIKYRLIYSIEEPKKAEIVKEEKSSSKKFEEKQVVLDKHKYDDYMEPDLMHTRQLQIIDKAEYSEDIKPTLLERIFSKNTLIAVICVCLLIGAVFAINASYSSINEKKNKEVVCIEGYANINGECIKTSTLTPTTSTTTTVVSDSEIEVIKTYKNEE